jgi:hypothetical protein
MTGVPSCNILTYIEPSGHDLSRRMSEVDQAKHLWRPNTIPLDGLVVRVRYGWDAVEPINTNGHCQQEKCLWAAS